MIYAVLVELEIPDFDNTDLKIFPTLEAAEKYLDKVAETKGADYFEPAFDSLGKKEFGVPEGEPTVKRDAKYACVYYETEGGTVGLEAEVYVFDPGKIKPDGSMAIVG